MKKPGWVLAAALVLAVTGWVQAAPTALSVNFTDPNYLLGPTDDAGDTATAGSFDRWNNVTDVSAPLSNLMLSNGRFTRAVTLSYTSSGAPTAGPRIGSAQSTPTAQAALMSRGLWTQVSYGSGSRAGQHNVRLQGLNSLFPDGYRLYVYANQQQNGAQIVWSGIEFTDGALAGHLTPVPDVWSRIPGQDWANQGWQNNALHYNRPGFSGNWTLGHEVDFAGDISGGVMRRDELYISDYVNIYRGTSGGLITGFQIVGDMPGEGEGILFIVR